MTITSLGLQAFYSSGTASWNSLPTALRQPDVTLGVFKRQLKSFIYINAGLWTSSPRASMWRICVNCACWNVCLLTYLRKPKAKFSRLVRHPAWKWSATILVEWEKEKKERKRIYIAPFIYYIYLKALRHGSHSFTCKYTMPAFPSYAFTRWRHL